MCTYIFLLTSSTLAMKLTIIGKGRGSLCILIGLSAYPFPHCSACSLPWREFQESAECYSQSGSRNQTQFSHSEFSVRRSKKGIQLLLICSCFVPFWNLCSRDGQEKESWMLNIIPKDIKQRQRSGKGYFFILMHT
jgi:hypothetical protein